MWLFQLGFSFFLFFFKECSLLIYLFLAALGLRFCARAFSSCGKRGPLLIAVCGPLTVAASLVAEHRLQKRRLSNCGSRAQPLRGIRDLPRPGIEPVSPALAGRLPTTAPPGKPHLQHIFISWCFCFLSLLESSNILLIFQDLVYMLPPPLRVPWLLLFRSFHGDFLLPLLQYFFFSWSCYIAMVSHVDLSVSPVKL